MKTKSSKTKTTKTSTIRSIDGYRLRLTPTRLIQIDHTTTRAWFAKKENIRKAYRDNLGVIFIEEVATGKILQVTFTTPRPRFGRIGCCQFEEATFKKILHYFGVRRPYRTLAAKAGA